MSTQKIFFSYSRADSPFALTLAKDLREAGADIWIDQLDIPAGSHWDAAVEKALNSATYVLVILTNSSTGSTNVMDEVSFALESGKKIIPVLLEDCLAPFRLRRLQRIDFTTDYKAGFSQLIVSLNLSLGNAAISDGVAFENFQSDTSGSGTTAKDTHDNEYRDNSLWEEACKLNTIASYRRYLSEMHSGLFREEAMLMIKQLEVEQKEDELEALVWQKAKNENAKNLYQHYLQEYPQGNYKSLALAALSEFERAEKEEERRLNAIALQQEKERAQKAKEEREKQELQEKERAQKEKEKQDQLDREKALKAKAEKDKQDQLDREKAIKAKEEKDKQAKLEQERAQKAKEEREKQEKLERERAQKAKEEREKQLQVEKEKALQLKLERDKALAVEKEIAQKAKEEREKQLREEREKAQREKAEREKQKQQEKEKAALLKQQEKEKVRQERIAKGLPPDPPGSGKKYALIGAGVVILCLGIWLLTKGGPAKDDRTSWKEALEKNDSTAFASYMAAWPEGKYFTNAKERIDSLYWVEKAIKDSLAAIEAAKVVVAEVAPIQEEAPPAEVVSEPEAKKSPEVKPKATTSTKPKATTPATKPTPKPSNTPSKISLGQEYGGGIVIYVNAKGDHGMIVSSKEVGSVDFEKAQKICAAYKVGTLGGWKLPSKDELNIIYQNRSHLGTYTKGGYWSSSEEGKNNAWSQNFSNGNQSKANKQSNLAVRAVRPF